MKSIISLFLLLSAFSCVVEARVMYGKDVTVAPEKYFSTNIQGLDSAAILPPPPSKDSLLFAHDRAMYEQGITLRETSRGLQAAHDADVKHLPEVFSASFGGKISKETMPEIYSLIQRTKSELGNMSTRMAKDTYKRIRPFALYNAHTCYPKDEKHLKNKPSYPSGHSARGWGIALLLSEINPGRKELILRRGYEYGQSRVICGYHWQSDVDAGRLVGAAGVANLHANEDFLHHLQRAKEEFKNLVLSGKVKTD